MVKVLLIDNYDSFTWNLVQILRESGICDYKVVSNDQLQVGDCAAYSHLLFSPGPGLPSEAGITKHAIKFWSGKKAILGVCLGHQAIAEVFGASLKLLPHPIHGIKCRIEIRTQPGGIFSGFQSEMTVGRYHSWVVDPASLTNDLIATAFDENENIMALQHCAHPTYGVQFHPESILTPHGTGIIHNWLMKPFS